MNVRNLFNKVFSKKIFGNFDSIKIPVSPKERSCVSLRKAGAVSLEGRRPPSRPGLRPHAADSSSAARPEALLGTRPQIPVVLEAAGAPWRADLSVARVPGFLPSSPYPFCDKSQGLHRS